MRYLLLLFYLFIATSIYAQSINGKWKGVIQYKQVDVPFLFEVNHDESNVQVTLINGEERLVCRASIFENDSLFVKISPFDVLLKARIEGQTMTGVWEKGYRRNTIPFKAVKNLTRFELDKKKKSLKDARWALIFESSNVSSDGVGLFDVNKGIATGTVLTTTGDYRYMSGVYRNDSLLLSSFDGAHGFLLEVKVDGKELLGTFHMDNDYMEVVKGKADLDAKLPKPFKVIEGSYRPYFDILSAGDASIKIPTEKYFNKVLVIQLFGTWCPNSMDQSNFLREWYQTKPEQVEVLGVTFEPNFSTEYGNQRIEEYKLEMNLPYDISLGGKLSKGQAALSLPHTSKINAFPTLILVDKVGFIRYEFDYFNGPATGIFNEEFIDNFEKRVAELVAE